LSHDDEDDNIDVDCINENEELLHNEEGNSSISDVSLDNDAIEEILIEDEEIDEKKQEDENVPKEITISLQEYNDLKQEIQNEKSRYNELFDRFQRVQADFDNYKKFLEKEKSETISYASGQLVKKLLNVLDNFERALDSVDKKNDDPFIEGIKSIYKEFYNILEKEGLKLIDSSGKFDPFKHECLITEERDDYNEDDIIEVLSKGYMFKDKILRPAMVKVARKKRENNENKENDVNKNN